MPKKEVKKIIAIDLDEVLSETLASLLHSKKNRINGKKVHRDEVTHYNLWELENLGVTLKKAIRIFFGFLFFASFLKTIKPVRGAKTRLKELKKNGYTLYVVTARHFILMPSTIFWLHKHFYGLIESTKFANFFTKGAKKKSDLCKEIGATIMIEDNLENAIDCAHIGMKVYLIDKPWNQHYDKKLHTGIIKVKDWSEIHIR